MAAHSNTLLCAACYKDRLASVCENADEYRLFDIRDHGIYPAGLLSLPSKDPMDRTSAILACGVSFLLCGAICALTRTRLERGGVQVVPWLTGSVDEVLKGFLHNTLSSMIMPGCGKGRSMFLGLRSIDAGEVRSKRPGRGSGRKGLRLFSPPDSAI